MKPVETRIADLELEVENLRKRIEEHDPIVNAYGNRNILFRIIGLIVVVDLLLQLFR